jgi:hypothetical protein
MKTMKSAISEEIKTNRKAPMRNLEKGERVPPLTPLWFGMAPISCLAFPMKEKGGWFPLNSEIQRRVS